MKRLVVSLLMIFLVIGVGVASVAAESQLYKNQFEVIVKIPEFARVVVPEVFYLGEVILDKNMQNQSADPITEIFFTNKHRCIC